MDLREDKVIGIVGGMGPEAGLALYNSILRLTGAATDQQHLSVILMSFPKHIADRTAYIEGSTPVNPAYNVAEIICKLERSGAQVVGIACNTSHAPEIYNVILEQLEKAGSNVTLINMPRETCLYLKREYTHAKRIGLMTTNGTYRSGIYRDILQGMGYDVVVPDYPFQDKVIHRAIYDPVFGIKSSAGSVTQKAGVLLDKALTFFRRQNCDAVILGCTELSLAVPGRVASDMTLLDCTNIFARALIREAKSFTDAGVPA